MYFTKISKISKLITDGVFCVDSGIDRKLCGVYVGL